MTKRVLVIDDEISIRRLLRVSLESNGYEVCEAKSGGEGLEAVISSRPDAVLLDLGLPDLSGIEVLKRLRGWTRVPVIILTARDYEQQKVDALDQGADDYVTKPFGVAELLARIRVAIRHRAAPGTEPVFRSGPLFVDKSSREVRVAGVEVRLSPTEYALLRVLTEYSGKVVTHRQLLQAVWGPNAVEHTQYLRVYVGQLRKHLKVTDSVPELIRTESGVGYRLLVYSEETKE